MHIKKHKGNIGLTKIIACAVLQEFNPSLPLCDHLKYDLILEKDGICKKAQIKYASVNKKGVISPNIKSVWSNKKGNHVKKREQGDYDLLCVYCPDTDKCYFIADSEFTSGTCVALRLTESKSSNPVTQKNAKMAKDYESLERAFAL